MIYLKYIDSHAHYTSGRFNSDREIVLKSLFNEDLQAIIECGTNTQYIAKVLSLSDKFPNLYTVIGYFPTDTKELENDNSLLDKLAALTNNAKVLGIGEIGLDYHHEHNVVDIQRQKKWFIEQLKLAKKLQLPICIHSREAEKDTVEILKNNGKYHGVIHCYSYGVKTMFELQKLGYYFGVGGTSTYKNNVDVRNAIKQMPLNRILLETDSPYLTPEPYRRQRNDSSKIKYVISELSKLKGVSEEKIITQTNENCMRLYTRLKEALV